MQTTDVHILLIDDEPAVIEETKEWLLEDFGYRNIDVATSAQAALEKLQNSFDVIISDMRMEANDSGFTILEYVRANKLSSFVIIFTANDNAEDSRKAFKADAWDYLSKNMSGNPFEMLHQSIQQAIQEYSLWGNKPNEKWFSQHQTELETQYWGQYIAIVNQAVIDSDVSEDALISRLDERQLRRFTTTIRKIGDLLPIAELRTQSESQTLEFKSTLAWDVRRSEKNEKLQHSVLKTIAAFLNTDGGTLLIGVDDNGQIVGLEPDYSIIKNGSRDQFELYLRHLVRDRIGQRFLGNLEFRFETLEHKDVCAIYVKRSETCAFLKGEKSCVEFYIRAGNQSNIQTVPEIYNYVLSPGT